jgi:hypothetical protein
LIFLALSEWLAAQDSNIPESIEKIEKMLYEEAFEIRAARPVRYKNDPAKSGMYVTPDSAYFRVKIMAAPLGGEAFNRQPRYELAAYLLQKMFLDPPDYVVPPTAVRSMPLKSYRQLEEGAEATFDQTSSVIVTVQYWLNNVTAEDFYDKKRVASDSVYARCLGNFNIFTYLADHKDVNPGNYLISKDPSKPRVFAVDNGVAFGSEQSDRGTEWRNIRVNRLPKKPLERLRNIRLEDLDAALGVTAQFQVVNGFLSETKPTGNLDPSRGVRKSGNVIQLGLTKAEIKDIYLRIQNLLKKVDDGKIELF